MKNVTITIEEAVADWVRVHAAKNSTSVSRLVGDLLKQKMKDESDYRFSMNDFLQTTPVILKKTGSYPRRSELHER